MIYKFDAEKFGSFKGFKWDTSVRDFGNNVIKFKKMNIIYGRNYSGKTTLSRLARCLETGYTPEKYTNPTFNITTDKGNICEKTLDKRPDNIRVYNKDFIDENLGFLKDDNGEITPFAIMGGDNKSVLEKIAGIEKKIGSIENKCGIAFELYTKQSHARIKNTEKDAVEKDINGKLAKKATQDNDSIKQTSIYKEPNYNIAKIRADIEDIKKHSYKPVGETERAELVGVLQAEPMQDISWSHCLEINFQAIVQDTDLLLTKKITPTQPIQELLNDSVLQSWVKQGMPLHKDRMACAFCRQSLPQEIWETLNNHFSEESVKLESDIESISAKLSTAMQSISDIKFTDKIKFYKALHAKYDTIVSEYSNEKTLLISNIDHLQKSLQKRKSEIFTIQNPTNLIFDTQKLLVLLNDFSALVSSHNTKSTTLSDEQSKARKSIRLSDVSQYIITIGHEKLTQKLQQLEKEVRDLEAIANASLAEVDTLNAELVRLRLELKDERKGAQKVNEILSHYFGHDSLELKAVEEFGGKTFKFQIFRGKEVAYNLSEGECSLVAFCYYIAKLDDVDSSGRSLVIFIDDPISSLDSNHIFFIYSLIENCLAKPYEDSAGIKQKDNNGNLLYRYEQLFISTHNLEFLKYTKRLSHPKNELGHFHIILDTTTTKLLEMPRYLKDYVTELNYLFSEICICAFPANLSSSGHCFYGFGNVLRKFLEAYLFFKYPTTIDPENDHKVRLKTFFGDDAKSQSLIERISNEYSHLHGRIDRCAEPIDANEISSVAKYVLKRMKESDHEQYKCFLQSVSSVDPLDAT